MEIEENWDKVRTVTIPTGAEASSERLAPLLSTLPPELRGGMERFIAAAYAVRRQLRGERRGRPLGAQADATHCPCSRAGSGCRRAAAGCSFSRRSPC